MRKHATNADCLCMWSVIYSVDANWFEKELGT